MNPDGLTANAQTGMGRSSTYNYSQTANGFSRSYTSTMNDLGSIFQTTESVDGQLVANNPDGTSVTSTQSPDPRWGMQAPYISDQSVNLPDGTNSHTTRSINAQLTYPNDPISLLTLGETTTLNGDQFASDYNGVTRSVTSLSPMGKQTYTQLDAQGRVTSVVVPGQDNITYTYDSRGLMTQMSQGSQSKTYVYDSRLNLVQESDNAGNTVNYNYDADNRVYSMTVPGGRTYQFSYDPNGNCTSLKTPYYNLHGFEYDSAGRVTKYTPPGSTPYTYQYNDDGQMTGQTLPSGQTQTIGYDNGGRVTSLDYDAATINTSYLDSSSRLASVTRESKTGGQNQTITYSYNGPLVTGVAVSGSVNGAFNYTYDNNFNLSSVTLNGTSIASYAYNKDGRMTQCGPFQIARSATDGSAVSINDERLTSTMSHDTLGRLTNRTSLVNGHPVYQTDLTYDSSGRIATETETAGSDVTVYSYGYNAAGELESVSKNGVEVESYQYDNDGNRVRRVVNGVIQTGSFDSQDRLTNQGGTHYAFDADGFMTARDQDAFDYSSNGELLSASIASGPTISYDYDSAGRRISRTGPDGTEQYLYGNPLTPFKISASIDGAVNRRFTTMITSGCWPHLNGMATVTMS